MKLKEIHIDVLRCDIEIKVEQDGKNKTVIPPGVDAKMRSGILRMRESEHASHPRLIRLYLEPSEMDEAFPKVLIHQQAGNLLLQADALSYLKVEKQIGKCKIVKTAIERGELSLSRCSLRMRECYGDFLHLHLSKCNCYLSKNYFHDLVLQAEEAKLAATSNRGVAWKLQQTGKKPVYLERLDVQKIEMDASSCVLSQLTSNVAQIRCRNDAIFDQMNVGCCQLLSTQGNVDIDMSDSHIAELDIFADQNIYYRFGEGNPLHPEAQYQTSLTSHDHQPKVLSLVSNKGIISV